MGKLDSFYRIEDHEGVGPYHREDSLIDTHRHDRTLYLTTRPTPRHDEKLSDAWEDLNDHEDYVFGFATLSQCKAWFAEDYFWLRDNKYNLVRYSVPKRLDGSYQSIARKDSLSRRYTLKLRLLVEPNKREKKEPSWVDIVEEMEVAQ